MSPLFLKVLVIAGALVIWFWSQRLIARKPDAACAIGDTVHRATGRWHQYFIEHEKVADRVLAISSFFIDLMGLSMIALSVFGHTFAPFLAILIVFSLRQVCQLCCTLPPPPGMIWRDPGVPSALVTYAVGNDFFFSGHTALAVLGAFEICQVAPWWLGAVAVLIALGEVGIVLVLRAHYTLDVITGVLAAWFAVDLAARYAPSLDALLN
jgi:hypothetical protein